ncbi:synaptotagmin-like protein 1 [Rhinatrema bivittatum]|uniref:synaptotagmin-like protein 1 n=1 Tax=Rhinatrema bivittatum TaxID=194408 RepID=UPI00112DCFC0|nr:synaptotagmin-like protein 1 [Rhinatrema bivittatum]XP_029475368.1 synaptotagmin-like protein 1 [Rhinatrema bivittatum]
MSQDTDAAALLDLSFLTEEEQNAIAEVLMRDAQLRQKDEGRIRRLRQSILDPGRLKVLTGDWFSDVRAKRHRDQQFASDIIRASIRRKKRPKGAQEPNLWPDELDVIGEPAEEEEEAAAVIDSSDVDDRVPEDAAPPTPQPLAFQDTGDDSLEKGSGDKSDAEVSNGVRTQVTGDPGESDMEEIVLSPMAVTVQNHNELENGHEESAVISAPIPRHALLINSSSVSSLSSSTLSGSIMSLYSDGDIGNVEVKGCIQFSLQYDTRKKELHVVIIQCRDLAEAKKHRADPYVKTYLLPDKSSQSKRKTAVKKRCLNPLFNETLKYKIEKSELHSRFLNLSVWHHDSLGRNLFLGEVEIGLSTWDWTQTQPSWFNLQPRTPVSVDGIGSRGTITVSLKFIPNGTEGVSLPPTGELHIWVKEAQNLLPLHTGTVDAFVKCYILPDDSKSSRQKTRVIKKSLNPVFNHTMVYDGFRAEDLVEACAELTVCNQDTFSNQQLGGIRLSLAKGMSYGMPVTWMDSTAEEKQVWDTVIHKPNVWVEASLPLRTSLTPRT